MQGNEKIWLISLIALLAPGLRAGMNMPLRIAIAANALVILLYTIGDIRKLQSGQDDKTETQD